jgi:hypothetical protein
MSWGCAGHSVRPGAEAVGGQESPGCLRPFQATHCQPRYRNSADFCTTDTFDYTNAADVLWEP